MMFAGTVLIVSSLNINRANEKANRTTRLSETMTQMRFVTFEHLLRHDERSLEQWNSAYSSISGLLAVSPIQSPSDRKIMDKIQDHHAEIKTIFDRLVASYKVPLAGQNPMTTRDFQERLTSQLLIKQQAQISETIKLAAQNQAEIKAKQELSNFLTLLVILLMFLVTAINSFVISANINKSLSGLQKGAKAISHGKLHYRIEEPPNDEFGRLAKRFNAMAVSLEALDRIKSEFILLASHQLRTPLTAIKWSSEELTSKKRQLDKAKAERYLNQIHESNERMILLVSALLNVAKIDLGSLPLSPEHIQLSKVIDDVLKDLMAQIHQRRIHIEKDIAEGMPRVFIDPSWARIVFQNLVSNAVKYSSRGQTVTISIHQKGTYIIVAIKDKGCGIPAAQAKRIFTKLFRADNALKMESEGSGIGLYVAKAMVEEADGKIWFESVENKGSTFYVKLPVSDIKHSERGQRHG